MRSGVPWRSVIVALLLSALAFGAAALASARPSGERDWIPQQAVLPSVMFDGDSVHIRNVRNFSYASESEFTPAYYDRSYDLSKLESAWFVLTPFYGWWRGPGHTLVSFGFSDSTFLAVSVEARREKGEEYGPLKGLFRRYELMYVIGDERDLIGLRGRFGTYPVYLYPIRGERARMRQVLGEMLRRAEQLRMRPEFYNTLTNNCTSNVVAHVNGVAPGRVPGGIKTILPGYTDEVAHRLGLIDTEVGIETARERFNVNERARRYHNDSLFSWRIR
ncbi:MAG TPA: DUF4105 domain-containing protein [Gemmatimonadaceae bacterium]|nr:DUF4105 domain-containing protein [Gemmatimonadaceae bacterium]